MSSAEALHPGAQSRSHTADPLPAPIGPDGKSRWLLMLAVDDYQDGDDGYCQGIRDQVAELQAWWSEPGLGERCFAALQPPFTSTAAVATVSAGILTDTTADDVLVVCVTGHGLPTAASGHYLCMPGGDDANPIRDHVDTASIVRSVLASRAEHAVVIVNSCFGTSVADAVRAAVKELPRARRDLRTLAVVTLGDFQDRPRTRELTQLLRHTRERLVASEITTPHLSVQEFVTEMAQAAAKHGLVEPMTAHPLAPAIVECLALPNPGYRATTTDVVAPHLREVAATSTTLDYWVDRASGRAHESDPGWYFSGRRQLTAAIATVLAREPGREHDTGSLIVTGAVGSGKSALLARAVTLSDATFLADPRYAAAVAAIRRDQPETIPPPGCIDLALHVRHQEPVSVLMSIARAAGVPAAQIAEIATLTGDQLTQRAARLRERLFAHGRGRRITIVLDGIDEATDPWRIVSDVVIPLARHTGPDGRTHIRFLLGVRSAGERAAGDLVELLEAALPDRQTLRVDEGAADDIADYLLAMLDDELAPPHGSVAREWAGVVAGRLTPSFLDARFLAMRLRDLAADAPGGHVALPPITDPSFERLLARGTAALLAQDLRDFAGDRATDTLAVLRAAAFGLGRGVPRHEVWPLLAAAVADAPITDADELIASVLGGRFSGFLAQDVEDDRRVYRPVHEGLADALKGWIEDE